MIIGSGLLARSFTPVFSQNNEICIYAAGVSNSGCQDTNEFTRERNRLLKALESTQTTFPFVYFGTCSVHDPESSDTPYVQHKLAMERIVAEHPNHLIFRLPQVAGITPNPHTLLNYLYARISRSEAFSVWQYARRNIIDVDDIVKFARYLIEDESIRNIVINIANPANDNILDIVAAMERAVGKPAIYTAAAKGTGYTIDVSDMLKILPQTDVNFENDYLTKVIKKYYGKSGY
jgi:nucleoside-diphosphate-sugar epimerase